MPPGRLPREVFQACPTGRRPRRKTQDTLERLCLSAGLGTPRVPPEELEEVSGVREEVWASLLRLLPPCDPVPDQADEEEEEEEEDTLSEVGLCCSASRCCWVAERTVPGCHGYRQSGRVGMILDGKEAVMFALAAHIAELTENQHICTFLAT
ncbi:hypothetical protein L3Q82_009229, partial [Scortum barcoo]